MPHWHSVYNTRTCWFVSLMSRKGSHLGNSLLLLGAAVSNTIKPAALFTRLQRCLMSTLRTTCTRKQHFKTIVSFWYMYMWTLENARMTVRHTYKVYSRLCNYSCLRVQRPIRAWAKRCSRVSSVLLNTSLANYQPQMQTLETQVLQTLSATLNSQMQQP